MKHRAPLIVVALAMSGAPSAVTQGPPPAVPLDPVSAILDAFQSHNVVALGEPHMIEQGHALRVALVRDPRFARTVNDIVWECGSARYQGVMDRYMSGEAVSDADLRETWRNMGAVDFEVFATNGMGGSRPNRWAQRGGKRIEIPKDQWRSRRMDEQFDAIVYLGPPSAMTRSRLSPATCADSAYITTRLGRMALVGVPTDALKKLCGIGP